MFFLGFVMGAAAAVWFILADRGERVIRLGGRMSAAARAFREWSDGAERFGD